MTRFTGRAKEKVTISSKPIPTGIKDWALAEKGYFSALVLACKTQRPSRSSKKTEEIKCNSSSSASSTLYPALEGPWLLWSNIG